MATVVWLALFTGTFFPLSSSVPGWLGEYKTRATNARTDCLLFPQFRHSCTIHQNHKAFPAQSIAAAHALQMFRRLK